MTWKQEQERRRCQSIQVARWRREQQEAADAKEARRREEARDEIAPEPDDDQPTGPVTRYEPEWARRHRLKREEQNRQSMAFALARPDREPETTPAASTEDGSTT
jgi:hypothetical protein